MIFFDTETCGLHGVPVLLQYAEDDGPITVYDIWEEPISQTMELIEHFVNHDVCGFNLTFDWFHLVKLYNMFLKYQGSAVLPIDDVRGMEAIEREARDGVVLKPHSAVDLMLIAHAGEYQITKERKDVRIKKVPNILASELCDYLNRHLQLEEILFDRKKVKSENWRLSECKNWEGFVEENFKDIVLKFAPSGSLKSISRDIFGGDPTKFSDLNCEEYPEEKGYAPFSTGQFGWPLYLKRHVQFWKQNTAARKYAYDDVVYTRNLYRHFGNPPADTNSLLTIMVANVRWKGFEVDINRLRELQAHTDALSQKYPTSSQEAGPYLKSVLSPEEQALTKNSTAKEILVELAKWRKTCETCGGMGCNDCDNKGDVEHPVAVRAKNVTAARTAGKQSDLFKKIIEAGRFHPSFKVMGALSNRMSGSDGLNAQGIDRKKEVRSAFLMNTDPSYQTDGGDFDAFEVCIAEAVFDDPKLREDLTVPTTCHLCHGRKHCYLCERKPNCEQCYGIGCSNCYESEVCPVCKGRNICPECKGAGKAVMKIHALFAEELFPDSNYGEILASKGSAEDLYTEGKQAVFSQIYGGDENTIVDRSNVGVTLDAAKSAREGFMRRYPGIGRFQKRIHNDYCSMKQPEAFGRVFWDEPKEYVESLLHFRRYFTIENRVCKFLFDLAETIPKEWSGIRVTVVRRDREQFVGGAVRSALFAAAFAIQAKNMRAAANHIIQSTGGGVTKELQLDIWNVQPQGIGPWLVRPMNIHDEILSVNHKSVVHKVAAIVKAKVESFRPTIPLIAMEWKLNMKSWGEK